MNDQFDLDHQDDYHQELPEILEPEVAEAPAEAPEEVPEKAALPAPLEIGPPATLHPGGQPLLAPDPGRRKGTDPTI